jgi:hypothetical protein
LNRDMTNRPTPSLVEGGYWGSLQGAVHISPRARCYVEGIRPLDLGLELVGREKRQYYAVGAGVLRHCVRGVYTCAPWKSRLS